MSGQSDHSRVWSRAPSMLQKVEPANVPARIAETIRDQVARGVISPGMRLGQSELAKQFAVSRVPVREGLKLLTAEGIVVHDPNKGFHVARFSTHEAKQLFRLRALIENELLDTIRWPAKAELAEFARRANELEALLNAGDRAAWWVRHREFHQMIFDLSPDKVFVREAMRFWSLTDRFRSLLPLPVRRAVQRDVVRKNDLVKALRSRDHAKVTKVRAERREAFERLVLETLADRGL